MTNRLSTKTVRCILHRISNTFEIIGLTGSYTILAGFVVLPDTSFMEFIDGSSRLASQPRWDPPVLLNDLPGGVKVIHFLNDVIPEQLIKDETIRQVAKAELQARWRRLGAIPFPRVSFSLDSISQSQETVVILDAEAGVAASVPGKISLRQTDATLTLLIDSPNVVQESIKISISENVRASGSELPLPLAHFTFVRNSVECGHRPTAIIRCYGSSLLIKWSQSSHLARYRNTI
jgi:hypothetical protein